MTDAERIEVLALAYALLDGSPWFSLHRPGSGSCEAYCVLTAYADAWRLRCRSLYSVAAEEDYRGLRALLAAGIPGRSELDDGWALRFYNDAPGRRKRDVLRLYEKAAAKIGK